MGRPRTMAAPVAALALALGLAGCGAETGGDGDDGAAASGDVAGTARGALGPGEDGTGLLQVETADGGITEVVVPSGVPLACTDGSSTLLPDVAGKQVTATIGDAEPSTAIAGPNAVVATAVTVDC